MLPRRRRRVGAEAESGGAPLPSCRKRTLFAVALIIACVVGTSLHILVVGAGALDGNLLLRGSVDAPPHPAERSERSAASIVAAPSPAPALESRVGAPALPPAEIPAEYDADALPVALTNASTSASPVDAAEAASVSVSVPAETTAGPLLVIGIPTVRRANDPDYVSRTLAYLSEQLDATGAVSGSAAPLRVRVVVLDNTRDGDAHAAFVSARMRACAEASAAAPCVTSNVRVGADDHETVFVGGAGADARYLFTRNGRPRVADGDDAGSPNVPGARVRAQARDVADLLALAHGVWGARMDFYMFLEDDFRVCPFALRALAYGITRASAEHASPAWNALRVSFGLNGGVLRGADVPTLAAYLREHAARRPPDHLWVEWFAGEKVQSAAHKRGRPHVAFRYNLLEHFGRASSLRVEPQGVYAYCYDELNENVVFEVEAYKRATCGHDDVWPCWPAGDPRYAALADSGLNFEELAKSSRETTVQNFAEG